MYAKKSLGQNFLMHARIAERIVMVSGVDKNSIVLEIGPGTGMLTRELLSAVGGSASGGKNGKVIAVEADDKLFAKLQNSFAGEIAEKRLELIHGDIREYPNNTAIAVKRGYCVVANIPYYLTGEIFRMFLESDNQPSAMTLLVQKEVADRIVARDKKESILSLSVKAYGTPKREFLVPRGAFKPAPNVDSAVLTIKNISRKNFSTKKEEERFFKLLHAGFAHKRKLVQNNLKELVSEKALLTAGVPEGARAEDLSLSDWLALCR